MDTLFTALRVIVSLGAVFGALWFAHRWITKGRPARLGGGRRSISVLAKTGLGAKAGVALVEAGGRQYLLGVTEHAVTVLDRFDAEPAIADVVRVVPTGPVVVQTPFGDALASAVQAAAGTEVVETRTLPVVRPLIGTGALLIGRSAAPATDLVPIVAARPDAVPVPVPAGPHPTRRAARAAEAAAVRPSPIAGSILSPTTWRQTAAALKSLR